MMSLSQLTAAEQEACCGLHVEALDQPGKKVGVTVILYESIVRLRLQNCVQFWSPQVKLGCGAGNGAEKVNQDDRRAGGIPPLQSTVKRWGWAATFMPCMFGFFVICWLAAM